MVKIAKKLVKKPLLYVTFLLFLFTICSGCVKTCKMAPDLEKNGEGYRMSNIVNRINNGRILSEKFINWREEINELQ